MMIPAFLALAATATASPDAATWRRQSLLGEDAEYFFRYVTVSENPHTHYAFRRTQRLEKVRKSDLSIAEHFTLRDVAYTQDMESGVWIERPVMLPPFDLAGYMTRNAVHLPFSDDAIQHSRSTPRGSGSCSTTGESNSWAAPT